jgi:HlyD family secretion protein
MKSRRLVLGLVAATIGIAVAAGGYWWFLGKKTPETVEVHAQELRQTIVSSGQVMPPAEVRIDSLATGAVREIGKREGDLVKAGDVLVRLDEGEIDALIAQAEAAVAQARAGKTTLKATTLPQALETAGQIRANLGQARSELARQKKLFEGGVINASALETAENAVRIYESQEKAADLQVKAASNGGSATLSASATIALAEAQLAVTKVNKDRARIIAPMDGVITTRFVEVGETVRPGTALLVLTANGRTRIQLEPDERNLALLAKGQRAAVSAEAFPNESFEATLSYIAPAVNADRGTIEVRLDVPTPPAYLRPNMTVSVELQIQTRENALSLPLTAVQDLGSARPWVGVLGAHGKVTPREIQVGLRGDELVEVLSGVTEGERVVFEPPLAMKPLASGSR